MQSCRTVTPRDASSPSVSTSDGSTWVGSTSSSIESWKGIPFAQPPVGSLRFAPPVATNSSFGTYDATAYGFSCPQQDILAGSSADTIVTTVLEVLTSVLPSLGTTLGLNTSEDCLTLNIERPEGTTADDKLPVLFYVSLSRDRGGFLWGASATYDGKTLVARSVAEGTPIIYVSANYRLNSFGFLGGKEIAADLTTSGNAGLMDQRLALEWVQKYISAFGGDSTKVTIFGESAGATSIGYKMLAYDGQLNGLFRAAILESGSPNPVGTTASSGQASFDKIAAATNCSSAADKIACLRDVSEADLFLSYNTIAFPFLPTVDGDFLTASSTALLAAGKYAKIPVISGDVYDEGTLFGIGALNITTDAELESYMADIVYPHTTKAQRAEILKLYDVTQGSPFDTGVLNAITPQNKRIAAMFGDSFFQSSNLGISPGSCHATDLIAVFDVLDVAPAPEMQARWIAFANNLDPSVSSYIAWPKYGTAKNLIQFSNGVSTIIPDTYREAAIAYWTKIRTNLY
ncbi:hypothetical protein RQP46_001688 [Phenoliferia psychrophenolica]